MIDFDWLERHMQCPPLAPEERMLLEAAIQVISVPPDVPIIHQGHGGKALYLLRSGRVRIEGRSDDGAKVEIAAPRDLHLFGEMSFFSDESASADVIAEEHCTIYRIGHEQFEQLQQQAPQLAMSLMTMVVRNMGDTIRRLDSKFSRTY